MNIQVFVELLGVFSAVVVFISYLFNNQLWLRIINIVASVLFIAYGFLLALASGWINGWSTMILNLGCLIVHIVWIVKYRHAFHSAHIKNKDNTDTD